MNPLGSKKSTSSYNRILDEPNLPQQSLKFNPTLSRPSIYNAPSHNEYTIDYHLNSYLEQQNARRRWCCRFWALMLLFTSVLFLLVFTGVFVILPLIFKHSPEMQRSLIFQRWRCDSGSDFTNFRRLGINGVRNICIKYMPMRNSAEIVSFGAWHILPLALVYDSVENETFSYQETLHLSTYPVLLYFHSSIGNRLSYMNMYRVLRRYFHVIAFDYRGYGDSIMHGELIEEVIVEDCVNIYQWLSSKTEAPIYIWGYSLGASLSTHTVAKIGKEGIVPMPAGLFLESPFSTMRDMIMSFARVRSFSWLPWFEATIIRPMEANGLVFNTVEYIQSVDCPIMILHAEDDNIIPIGLAEKLYNATWKKRSTAAANVTFHRLPASSKCGHKRIYESSALSCYIREHIRVCESYNKRKRSN